MRALKPFMMELNGRLDDIFGEVDYESVRNTPEAEAVNALIDKLPELKGAEREDVEKIIDKASDNVLRCLEIASGSPLTEDEINATRKSQINNECPDHYR